MSAAITLRRVWADYQQTRKLKPKTVRNHEQRIRLYLSDWLDLPVASITKQMIEDRHRQISHNQMANDVMRTARALFNFARYKYEDKNDDPILEINPTKRLSELHCWHRERRRKDVIHTQQLKPWLDGVSSLDNPTLRDWLLLLLFTGMRSSEARLLRWADVDLDSGVIHLHNTKTGNDHLVVLSDFAWRLLQTRRGTVSGEYVFGEIRRSRSQPDVSKPFHMECGYKQVIARSGVKFMPHGLRRTYLTIGDELEIKNELLQALVNHSVKATTERYTIRSIERLREATQSITDAILIHAGVRQPKLMIETVRRLQLPDSLDLEEEIIRIVGDHEGSSIAARGVHQIIRQRQRVRRQTVLDTIKRLITEGWLQFADDKRWPLTGITCGRKLATQHASAYGAS